MNVEKKLRPDEAGRDEPDPSRWQELPQGTSQFLLWKQEGVRQGARRRNHLWQSWYNKFPHTKRSFCHARYSEVHFVLAHGVPRNASRPSESHNSFAVMEWKGTCYEMPRASFQSCWHLIYECGVCSPGASLIRWLSGLTSPMGIKGMISPGATGIERQKYVCTAMPVRFPFRDDIQGKTYIQESRCQGRQQAVEYFCCSSQCLVPLLCSPPSSGELGRA